MGRAGGHKSLARQQSMRAYWCGSCENRAPNGLQAHLRWWWVPEHPRGDRAGWVARFAGIDSWGGGHAFRAD